VLQRGRFSEMDTAILIKAVLTCVNYCHKQGIVHRDLKPENILIEANKEFDQIKIIDFGTAMKFEEGQIITEKLGTPYYIAPEILSRKYTNKVDVWSVGVITYILLSGQPPFNGQEEKDILKKIRSGKFDFDLQEFKRVSDDARNFISYLLTYDQEKRPSAEEAIQHPWLIKFAKATLNDTVALEALENLKGFQVQQTLKAATFAFITSQLLSKKDKEELGRVFRTFDLDGDGRLSMSDVQQGYQKHFGIVITDEEVKKMFSSVDADMSGFIDYSEFILAAMNQSRIASMKNLESAFKMFDRDGSGCITP
jgi:calcium-dependent protein kinase